MTEPDDLVGKLLGDRWSLRSRLGAGGMGAVYLADDARGGPPAAVKVVKRELLDDADARARFAREADALRSLDHPCIVRFLDTGETGELRFIAMEMLEGRTLKSRLVTRGAMPWRETIPIVRDVVRALQAAHAAGLIHRDLKPENIFLLDTLAAPQAHPVKLLDFGVARHVLMPAGQTMTGTGVVLGTPGFVAPEVVLKGPSNDPRSDFYGLGATWFEMLTGEKPFSAETPFALAMLHVSQAPPRPSTMRPGLSLPARAEALLLSLLAKTPEVRPPSSEVILEELAAIERAPDALAASGEPFSSLNNRFMPIASDDTPMTRSGVKATADLLPHEATAGFTRPTVTNLPMRGRTRTTLTAAAVLVALGAGVLVGARLLRDDPSEVTSTPAEPLPPASTPFTLPPQAPTLPPPPDLPPTVSEAAPRDPAVSRPSKPRPIRSHKPELLPLDPVPTPKQ